MKISKKYWLYIYDIFFLITNIVCRFSLDTVHFGIFFFYNLLFFTISLHFLYTLWAYSLH